MAVALTVSEWIMFTQFNESIVIFALVDTYCPVSDMANRDAESLTSGTE